MSASRTPHGVRRAAAEVYRKAAQRVCDVETAGYSCNAISKVSPDDDGLRRNYEEAFHPSQVWHEPEEDQRAIRVLMLCFMAAMVEAGDA